MVDTYRVRVTWSGPQLAGGGLTTLNFDASAGSASQSVSAVAAFLTAVKGDIAAGNSYEVQPDVYVFDGLGNLTAITTTPGASGACTAGGDPLPRMAQTLIRWRTQTFRNSRAVKGRTYLPGPTEQDNTPAGGPSVALRGRIDFAAAGLLAAPSAKLLILNSDRTLTAPVVSGITSSQYALLNSRRF